MSFLEPEDDPAALADALRFIDEFAQPCESAAARPKRVRDPAVYVRRRRKQKAELLRLREQATQLERQLRALAPAAKASSGSSGSSARRRASAWLALAMREQRARASAEQRNARLRTLLAAHSAASRALADELSGAAAAELERELGRVQELLRLATAARAGPPRAVGGAGDAAEVSRELLATVGRLAREARAAAAGGAAVLAVAHEQRVKRDPAVGAYTEAVGAAPLGRGVAHVQAFLQRAFWSAKFPAAAARAEVPGRPLTLEKREFVDLALPGGAARFSGTTVLLKAAGPRAVTFAYASLLAHPSGRLWLREGGWFVVHEAAASPARASVMRSCSRLTASAARGVSALDGRGVDELQARAAAALAQTTTLRLQGVQRLLLLATGRGDLARLLPDVNPFAKPRPTPAQLEPMPCY